MSIKKTIGGERLGSGNKMKTELHGYERSTHDLSTTWRSSMQIGVLTPCLYMQAEPGQTYEIAINHKILTEATNGPTFGIFDFRVDVFEAAIRLYNGLLHNNMVHVGLDMKSIKWPMLNLRTTYLPKKYCDENNIDYDTHQISASSLLNYLGIAGVGSTITETQGEVTFQYNALGVMMYYDIFKNYKANKQETHAVVISPNVRMKEGTETSSERIPNVIWRALKKGTDQYDKATKNSNTQNDFFGGVNVPLQTSTQGVPGLVLADSGDGSTYWIIIPNTEGLIDTSNTKWLDEIQVNIRAISPAENQGYVSLRDIVTDAFVTNLNQIAFKTNLESIQTIGIWNNIPTNLSNIKITQIRYVTGYYNQISGTETKLFELKNIDKARQILLQQEPGVAIILDDEASNQWYNLEPYYSNFGGYKNNSIGGNRVLLAQNELCGLCLATYNSDILNNWLNGEWITGTNGISAITNIDTSEGVLNLDILNIAQKTYNVLNRIIVSGATYEDWQEAVYGINAVRRAESPIYQGGQSSKIIFDEVIATGGSEPLGTMGGRGLNVGNSPGKLYIKCDEPSLIMAIASIIPHIDYSQGNYWFNRLTNLDEMHKPGYDRIGYQNLPTWKMAWWDMQGMPNTSTVKPTEFSAGKQPSWIQYQTNIDTCHGRFAKKNDMMFMTLNRRYECEPNAGGTEDNPTSKIADLTTYIDPTKYNYIFAKTTLDAQNFWVQIHFDIKSRWIGSANQIPNL